jgi:hypothetical protein
MNFEVWYSIIFIFEKSLSVAIPHFIISASGGFDIPLGLPFDKLRPRARRGELVAGCGSLFLILVVS